jgi:AcrR family transcriptional regulator
LRRPNLSQEKIIEAAIRMADEKGLDAVTLRGLARRLDVHVTSLYNHISTKEALFAAMNEALMAEADLPLGALTWRDWIRRYAAAIQSLALQHPGAFQLFQRGPARGDAAMRSLEAAIAAFQADGFDETATQCAIRTANVAVLGLALDELGRDMKPAIEAELQKLPSAEYPQIHRLLESGDSADFFGFLVDAIIDGIAANRDHGK